MLVVRCIKKRSVNRYTGIVDPRVDTTEALDGSISRGIDRTCVAHIGDREGRNAAARTNIVNNPSQGLAIARNQKDLRPMARCAMRNEQADAGTRASDDHHLFAKWLEKRLQAGRPAIVESCSEEPLSLRNPALSS
ncbi:hypothetical protein SBA_ch1_28910 [Sphingomonas bisphenolicum]|uniref:Uncharacterized protein n=1 Tax=Sphingomonas bisphenolicum TaxID=296544 RepID=A0ABN5WEC6_9SPHN|nr:hypothetical protein SBA_ch1_28910 [Sphingomonas bisphenolicum]